MRIGVFGGTFDPPHLGHLILAGEALYQLKLDKVLLMLTPEPPHKQNQKITALQDRLAMITAIAAKNPCFEISRVEMDRPGPHYTVDTIRLLQEQFLHDDLVFLIGGDSLREMASSWYKVDEIVQRCHQLGVMQRPGSKIDLASLEEELPGITQKLGIISAPLLEIASSDIRQRVAQGRPYQYYVTDEVFQIIRERGLYCK